MRPGMPSGRAHASVRQSCERLRRAAGALGRRGADALVARGKAVVEAAQEAVSAASGRQVIAVGCDTGDDQSVRDMVLAVTDGLGGVDIPVNAAARPDTGTVAGIDAFDDSEFSEQSTPRYSGQALPGERLLRDEGLLELRRGHGITVAGTPQRGAVLTQARELVRLARQHGYRDELIACRRCVSTATC